MAKNQFPGFIRRFLFLGLLALGLSVSSIPAWSQAARVSDQLPGSADMAVYANVEGLVKSFRPEVVQQLVTTHLSRFLGNDMPDPASEVQQAAVAVMARDEAHTQAVAILQNRTNAQALATGLRTRMPGQPELRTFSLRGVTMIDLDLPQGKSATLADLPDGHRLLGQHPAASRDFLTDTLAAVAEPAKSYTGLHKGSLDTTSLLTLHLGRPSALAANPQLARVPWDSVAMATVNVRRSGTDKFRLDIQAELTSWLKMQIIKPFVGTALGKAAANPKVPAAAQALLKRMTSTFSGKTMTLSVEASQAEIEALLLAAPGLKQPAA